MAALRPPGRDWAIVTGASSGIGRAFTESLARRGVNVVMTARDGTALASAAAHLEKTYAVKTLVYAADLTDRSAADGLVDAVEEANIRIRYLINNAGLGLRGNFTETDWKRENDMISLNIMAVTYLTKLYARQFADQGGGRIMNVSSTAAYFAGPYMAVYFAAKAYVLRFSQALHEELSGRQVTVTVLCPGPTDTGFAESAETSRSGFFKGNIASADRVAEYGIKAMLSGKSVAVPGFRNKLTVFAGRILPRSLTAKYIARRQE